MGNMDAYVDTNALRDGGSSLVQKAEGMLEITNQLKNNLNAISNYFKSGNQERAAEAVGNSAVVVKDVADKLEMLNKKMNELACCIDEYEECTYGK